MTRGRIHARAAAAGLAALGLLLLAGAPAWAHTANTTTTLGFSENPPTAGTIVTITATVEYDGSFGGGPSHTEPSNGDPVTSETVQIQMLQLDSEPDGSGDGTAFARECATGDVAVFEIIASGPTNGSGQFSTLFDTTGHDGESICFKANHPNSGGQHSSGQSASQADLIVQASATDDVGLSVAKTLISGPLESSAFAGPQGCNIGHYNGDGDACDGFASDFSFGPNDDGPIGITLLHSQHYVFQIKITNNGEDGEFDGTVLADTLGADWDMDPTAEEDFASDGDLDGVCADDCDGSGFDGVILLSGDCVYTLSQPNTGGDPPKEPEFLDILLGELDEGDMCTFLVFVNTVENPGQGNDFFEPTGCRELAYATDPDGNPIFDTFALNDGIKAFDGTDGDDTAAFRLFGPIESLQLYCNFPPE